MKEKEVYELMAAQGIRIFMMRLGGGGYPYEDKMWIHPNKTATEWRADVRAFLQTSYRDTTPENWASDAVYNDLYGHLQNLGYHEIEDMVADVYEGRVTSERARIVDNPDHEEQSDGFGHFGWEARALDPPTNPTP